MFNQNFYFSLIRKYVILVGTLFNDIKISRTDKNGNIKDFMLVPITYGDKDNTLARVLQDPDIQKQAGIVLPRISFDLISMEYDGNRKLGTTGKLTTINIDDPDNKTMTTIYNPVPYNFYFSVYVYVKNREDGTKIIEQILPYFTPDFTPTVILIPEMNIKHDIPITINSIETTNLNNSMTNFKDRQVMIYTLNMVLKGYLYGPIKKQSVIKFANTSFYISSEVDLHNAVNVTPISEKVTVRPGLTANGQPTSNLSLSVPLNEINASDDYGFITNIEEY